MSSTKRRSCERSGALSSPTWIRLNDATAKHHQIHDRRQLVDADTLAGYLELAAAARARAECATPGRWYVDAETADTDVWAEDQQRGDRLVVGLYEGLEPGVQVVLDRKDADAIV